MNQVLYLTDEEVRTACPPMPEILDLVEQAFREKAAGRVEMPAKLGVHPFEESFLHAMPASIPSMGAVGIKWISAYPGNRARGLPQIAGLLIVNDPETGLPVAILDAAWITAQRTGAASALGAHYLARPDSRTLGILGCGVQGRSHLAALSHRFRLETVTAFDVDRVAAERFAEEMFEAHRIPVTVASRPVEAVAGQDLVVTAGPITRIPHGTIDAGWLAPGGFAASVDFAAYWSNAAGAEFDRICTDDRPQFDVYRNAGYFGGLPDPHVELEDLVSGKATGRRSDTEKTMACFLGLALEDVVVAGKVVANALRKGIGTRLTR